MLCGRSAFAISSLFLMSCVVFAAPIQNTHPEILRDIEYAHPGGTPLYLDASLPRARESAPAVVIVHGGGWVGGDRRASVQPLFKPLSDAGFAWFSISYRLATNVLNFGLAINDVENAVAFVRSHAAEYGVDPNRIALVGESAGGQLAEMAALRAKPESRVSAVVALYAPSDLVTLAKTSDYVPRSIRQSLQGTPWEGIVLAGLGQLSPIDNVRAEMPPFLLVHGTSDRLVPYQQSVDMCARMRKAGANCELYPVEGGGHGVNWWEAYPRLAAPYKKKLVRWLEKQFTKAPAFTS